MIRSSHGRWRQPSAYKPEWAAKQDLPALRARNDYVIALTHLGVDADRQLVNRVNGIDLVIGGHSHTVLQRPLIEKNPRARPVAIVQAGAHGNYVGDLLVDLEPGKPLQLLHYKLVDVRSDGPRDAGMDKILGEAREHLDAEYGAEWLREIVGHSEVPLENAFYRKHPTAWSRFVGEAIRDAAGAEVALDIFEFEGFEQPPGPITREQLFVMYPRALGFDERLGYTIWTANVSGRILKLAVKEAVTLGLPVNPVGIEIERDTLGRPLGYLIGGRPIEPDRSYKVALPESVARGAFGLSRYLKLAFRNARNTGIPIWTASERYLKKIGGVIKAPAQRADRRGGSPHQSCEIPLIAQNSQYIPFLLQRC